MLPKRDVHWFGPNVRQYRNSKRMGQRAFAKETGFNKTTICKFENSEMLPSLQNALRISVVLGVSLDHLCKNPEIVKDELCKLHGQELETSSPD